MSRDGRRKISPGRKRGFGYLPLREDEGAMDSSSYSEEQITKAYRSGESGKTFYLKGGRVILPKNYEGIDG